MVCEDAEEDAEAGDRDGGGADPKTRTPHNFVGNKMYKLAGSREPVGRSEACQTRLSLRAHLPSF